MRLLRLLYYVSAAQWKRERLKSLLTLLGTVLGVGAFAAVRLCNINALRSFEESASLLRGPAAFSVRGAAGPAPESAFAVLSAVRGVRSVRARSSRFVRAFREDDPIAAVQFIGVDVLAYGSSLGKEGPDAFDLLKLPRSALISPRLGDEIKEARLEIGANSSRIPLEVLGVLPEEGLSKAFGARTVIADIAVYQELFGTNGHVDQFDIVTDAGAEAEVRAQLESLPGLRVSSADEERAYAESLTQAFRLNLNFLAAVSLFVAAILIYNTVSYTVLRRRRELAILVSLGSPPRRVFSLLCVENALFGLAAGGLGLMLGKMLATHLAGTLAETVSALYVPVKIAGIAVPGAVALECLVLGTLTALAAGIIPAVEVFGVSPREAFAYQDFERKFRRYSRPLLWCGCACLVLSLVTSSPVLLRHTLAFGFLPPAFLIAACVLIVPAALKAFAALCAGIAGRFGAITALLALDHIRMTLKRSSAGVSAMMVSLAMLIGVSTMILSFRTTVVRWIEHITTADLYVSAPYTFQGDDRGYLPEELLQFLGSHPLVGSIDTSASRRVPYAGREIRVMAVDPGGFGRFLLKKEQPGLAALIAAEGGAVVSETFANRYGAEIGQAIEILPGAGRQLVRNIAYDYTTESGTVYLSAADFVKAFGEARKQGVAVTLRNGQDTAALRSLIERRFPQSEFFIRDNRSLRAEVLRIFDQTFSITYALRAVALIISALTILNTVLMLLHERRREFAVMRAVGASARALLKTVALESFLLGAASLICGIAAGVLLSLILIFVVNRYFFGWSIGFVFPYETLFQTGAAVLVLAVVSGILPAIGPLRRIGSGALRYE